MLLLQAPEVVLQLQGRARVFLQRRLLLHFFGDDELIDDAAGSQARAQQSQTQLQHARFLGSACIAL